MKFRFQNQARLRMMRRRRYLRQAWYINAANGHSVATPKSRAKSSGAEMMRLLPRPDSLHHPRMALYAMTSLQAASVGHNVLLRIPAENDDFSADLVA